jgi:hypothetical protein
MQLAASAAPALSVLESVRCLECSEIYSKPVAGGTVHKNPGCPACGYVGWIPLSLPQESRPRHSAAGPQPLRFAPQR